jgi:hypothetical protein
MSDPWHTDGLRFACTRCGSCCRGAGTVRISEAETEALARRLALEPHEFRAAYTIKFRSGAVSLCDERNRNWSIGTTSWVSGTSDKYGFGQRPIV